jgi:uracil-DNA glycosylase
MPPPTGSPAPPYHTWSGPRRPKLLLIGEAWGESEDQEGKPFVGASGQELWRMLGQAFPGAEGPHEAALRKQWAWDFGWRDAWLEAQGIAMTNLFPFRPDGNNIETLCAARSAGGVMLPQLKQGKYFLEEHAAPALARLQHEISESSPNLLVPMGNVACWATLQLTNIGGIRGSVTFTPSGRKALPTYHPAAVLRTWSWRPIVVADLIKAAREAQSPDYERPARVIIVEPGLDEIREWVARFHAARPPILSADCETANGQITCISFAWTPQEALVIPFVRMRPRWQNYWSTPSEERAAWFFVRQLLETPWCKKLGQNFLYDLQYINKMGIYPQGCEEDTMLLHHSLHPELQKGLGFLGSIYTQEASWKLMARRKGSDVVKGDE